jgi:hypothetical protein
MNDDDNTITLDVTTTTGTEDAFSIYGTDTITVSDDYSFDFSNIDFNTFNPGIDVSQGDIKIHNDGDIKMGEQSLKEFMTRVEERLNILQPNPELEQQWNELRELGNRYRELEKELLEKNKMWEKLKEQ